MNSDISNHKESRYKVNGTFILSSGYEESNDIVGFLFRQPLNKKMEVQVSSQCCKNRHQVIFVGKKDETKMATLLYCNMNTGSTMV